MQSDYGLKDGSKLPNHTTVHKLAKIKNDVKLRCFEILILINPLTNLITLFFKPIYKIMYNS